SAEVAANQSLRTVQTTYPTQGRVPGLQQRLFASLAKRSGSIGQGIQEFLPLGFRVPTIQRSEPVRFLHLSPDGILFRRRSTQSGKDWQCQTTVEQATATRGRGKDLYHETLRQWLVCNPYL